MKKNDAFKFFIRLLSFVFLIIFITTCKSEQESIKSKGVDYIFENHLDNTSYFVKIDSLDDSRAEGRLYIIDDDLTMIAKPISIIFHKRKCYVELSENERFTLKFNTKSNDVITGKFTKNGETYKGSFTLYPYNIDDYQFYESKRYKEEIFDVEIISDVKYANVKGHWMSIPDDTLDVGHIVKMGLFNALKKKDLELDMDIYLPKNDTLSKRPLIMLIHGGAFFIGDKASESYKKWGTHYASLGYVCVSINYRMGFRATSKAIERTAYQATQDAHAAMRYLISKKDIYRIDPDCLFVGGASAGSITALNLAFMRNENRPKSSYSSFLYEDLGDLETSGNDIYNKFKIKAVANMWGTVSDLNMLNNSNASIISFHGDADVVLPYGYGYPFRAIGEFKKVFFDEMYGSSYIHQKANELGIRSKLHTFHGEGHALHLDENRKLNKNFYFIQDEIADFFYDELISNSICISQDTFDSQLFIIDTTDVAISDWNVIGGVLIEQSKGKVRASWFDDELHKELRVSGYYRNGTSFEDVYTIKSVQ